MSGNKPTCRTSELTNNRRTSAHFLDKLRTLNDLPSAAGDIRDFEPCEVARVMQDLRDRKSSEQVVAVGLVNSFVHVCMYSYYFLSSLGPSVQAYLWWKPYITRLQLAQFVFVVTFLLSLMFRECDIPQFFVTYMTLNAIVFLYLFTKFYINAYTKKKIT
ncbi:Elongation of very long chain fatty acids protein 7 [Homalodisca vitripennis]|nr:Elongation of very long chain fatty acids protein 7 [Homalodisca vitripennis]